MQVADTAKTKPTETKSVDLFLGRLIEILISQIESEDALSIPEAR